MMRVVVRTAIGLAVFATGAFGQEQRTVQGRVVRPAPVTAPPSSQTNAAKDTLGVLPVFNATVTLHRVGKDQSGPVDSMRTNAAGTYKFAWKATGATDAVYFTSVNWGGIAYFTAPLRNAVTIGDAAEITVYDTTSRSFPLTVSGRHLIVSAADSTEERTVVEVYELTNDSLRTLIAPNSKTASPTWSVAIPTTARAVTPGDGEVSPDAFSHSSGRVSIFGAISPGVKQVSFSYRIPVRAFPLPFTIEHGATVLEVLLEEPQGGVTGAHLVAADPVNVQGRNFRRFLAQDVGDQEEITIDLPSGNPKARTLYFASLLVASGAVMLLLLGRAMQRRRPIEYTVPAAVRRGPDVPMSDRLAREIADLDRVYERHESPNETLRTAYEQRRAELKEALAAELARSGTAL